MMKAQPFTTPLAEGERYITEEEYRINAYEGRFPCPYGQPGDRLWVRECFAIVPRTAYRMSEGVHQVLRPDDDHEEAVFRADWERSAPSRWRSSIHMPRWASRILLEIVSVRVERLNAISEEDAKAEGVEPWVIGDGWRDYSLTPDQEEVGAPPMPTARDSFRTLWESINGAESWTANPWVWVVEFRKVAA